MSDQLSDQTVCTPEQCREACGGTTFGTCAYPTPADLEVVRLRAENEALKRSWGIDAVHRDQCFEALKAVWGDMRGVDKHYVPAEVIALVAEAIGGDLDEHDPAYRAVASDEQRQPEEGR